MRASRRRPSTFRRRERHSRHASRPSQGVATLTSDDTPATYASYKYDLFKPVKRSNTKTARRRKNKSLSEVQEDGVVEEDDDEGPEVDSSSILSTGWTSVGQHSDYHSEVEGELEDDAIAPEPASLGQQSQMLAGKMVSETKKLFLPSTVLKGKRKILNLIKPTQTGLTSAPSTPSLIERRGSLPGSSLYSSYASSVTSLDLDRKKSINSHASSFGGQVVADPSSSGGSAAGPSRRSLDGNAGGVASPPRPAIKRQLSSKIRRSFSGRLDLGGPSPRDLASDDDTDDESAGPSAERTSGLTSDVYDTSAKARVPSCMFPHSSVCQFIFARLIFLPYDLDVRVRPNTVQVARE